MHLALGVGDPVGLALKELCAFLAVVLAQAGQILCGRRVLERGEMLVVAQVGVDLVEIARVAARLLLGVLSPYGGHAGRWARGRPDGGTAGRTVGRWRERAPGTVHVSAAPGPAEIFPNRAETRKTAVLFRPRRQREGIAHVLWHMPYPASAMATPTT